MNKQKIVLFASELTEAQKNKTAIKAITDRDADFNVADAYAVQMENVIKRVNSGDAICGKKIGLTSLAMQEMLGVDEPDYGHLYETMNIKDGKIDAAQLLQPKIEAELAFILKHDLSGGQVSVADVEVATDYVVAAFEIVDSRIADWKIKLPDTIADNASSACFVLGEKRLSLKDINVSEIHMSLYKTIDDKDSFVNEGYGSAVLDDPRIAVAWLANKLWDYGVTLKAGEIILSGAFSAAPPAAKGDKFKAVFTHFGTLEAEFV